MEANSTNGTESIVDERWMFAVAAVVFRVKILISVLGTVANVLVILLFIKDKKLRKIEQLTGLWCLAIADLMRTCGTLAGCLLILYHENCLCATRLWCVMSSYFPRSGHLLTGRQMMVVACERCYAIMNPLRYRAINKAKTAWAIFIAVLSFTIVENLSMFLGVKGWDEIVGAGKCIVFSCAIYYNPVFTTYASQASNVSLALLIASYVLLIYKIKKRESQITQAQESTQERELRERDERVIRTVSMTMFMCIMFYASGPFVMKSLRLIWPKWITIRIMMGEFSDTSNIINSSINIFVYLLKSSDFKAAFLRVYYKNKEATSTAASGPNAA